MRIYIIPCILAIFLFFSCKKEWLEKKPDNRQVVPSSIADAQAILDENGSLNVVVPTAEISSDDYYLTYSTWQSLALPVWKNAYTWNSNIWDGAEQIDWSYGYRKIFVANVALETLNKIELTASNLQAHNTAKGGALFLRATSLLDIANLYTKPYNASTADSDPGIPLRLNANVNDASDRGTVKQTYNQIIKDLKQSARLSPVAPLYKTRSSKSAAFGLLARTYLIMDDYANAALYADSCLQLSAELIDYNTLNQSSNLPFVRDNIESIYFNETTNWANLRAANLIVDIELYQSYHNDDLRKGLFYYTNGSFLTRKGSYTGTVGPFYGIATDEIYLTRAEARARLNDIGGAVADLNILLIKRFKAGTFVPIVVTSADDALVRILEERRKELVYRGLRWLDLRRLNKDVRFAKTITRVLNGATYSLPPNDKRYVFPLPEIEIRMFGLEQNPR